MSNVTQAEFEIALKECGAGFSSFVIHGKITQDGQGDSDKVLTGAPSCNAWRGVVGPTKA